MQNLVIKETLFTHGGVLFLIIPYVFYAILINNTLLPIDSGDAFTYPWQGGVNKHFWLGRSLTQRMLYYVGGNNPGWVINLNLGCLFLTSLALYLSFYKYQKPIYNLILALLISTIFSSYNFNISATILSAEYLHIALLITFPLILFFSDSKWRTPLLLIGGTLFIFSKNVSPYIAILCIGYYLIFKNGDNERLRAKKLIPLLVLLLLSISSIVLTLRSDTSLHINTVNNLMTRVFPYPERVRFFFDRYGMPDGDYVKSCQWGTVLTPCFNGESIMTANFKTNNYKLRRGYPDFSRWVRRKGSLSYTKFLLLDNLPETLAEYQAQLREAFTDRGALGYTERCLKNCPRRYEPSNWWRLHGDETNNRANTGFFGSDPLQTFAKFINHLGLFNLYVLGGLILTVSAANLLLPNADRSTKNFLNWLGCSLLAVTALFFLTIFGDGMEIDRHTLPPTLLYLVTLALSIFWFTAEGITKALARPK